MTQKDRIIEILRHDGQIDNFFCINTRLTIRLAMHIGLLRKAGWQIRTHELPTKNCVYYLIAEPQPKLTQQEFWDSLPDKTTQAA